MQAFPDTASANEIVIHYERELVKGNRDHAANIRSAHSDLTSRFDEVDERLARK